MNAGDVMTPRTQLKWIDLNGTEDEIMDVLKNANHYRIPVGTDSLDELNGLVTVSDVLVQIMQRPSESSIQDHHLSLVSRNLSSFQNPFRL